MPRSGYTLFTKIRYIDMEDTILRTVGQFQLKEDVSTSFKTFYVENTILTKQGKDSKSYKFGNSRKETMMLISDSEFVGRAIQAAGNNVC